MRIVFLCSEMAAYYWVCFKKLLETEDMHVLLVHWPAIKDAPYQFEAIQGLTNVFDKSKFDDSFLAKTVYDFQPDVLYVSGWSDKLYLQIARQLKPRALVIAGLDTQWKGTLKQHVASFISPFYLKRFFDVFWVPGKRQKYFAHRMGYGGKKCWEGLLTCDVDAYNFAGQGKSDRKKSFLYVGRYSPEKGIDVLAEAYLNYRQAVSDPWDLHCVGAGSYKPEKIDSPFIQQNEFIQPEKMPAFMADHKCLVLPSLSDAWGLVIHEAASTGLPVICTSACGAADHLVEQGRNGWIIKPGSAQQLTNVMLDMHKLSNEQWNVMSQESMRLSLQYSPTRWVETLMKGIQEFNWDSKAKK